MIREELRHLKWRLVFQEGYTEDEADERIKEVKQAEKMIRKIKKGLKE